MQAARQRISAAAHISAKPDADSSAIDTLYQQGSARIRFPRTDPGALQAVLLNTAGGLTGDDHIHWTASAKAHAHLNVSTAACEKIYRTHGPAACQTTTINVEKHGRVEWLPQESILFRGARLKRSMDVHLDSQADALIAESLVFGRQAMQESTDNIAVHDRWRIFRAGRLQHAEDLRLETSSHDQTQDNIAQQSCILHHYSASSTIVLLSEQPLEWFQIKQTQIHALDLPEIEDIRIGVSIMPSRLVIRLLASSSFQLRKFLIPCLKILNDGRPVPAVWNV